MNTPLACLALIAASALTAPALADGGVTVKLPPCLLYTSPSPRD